MGGGIGDDRVVQKWASAGVPWAALGMVGAGRARFTGVLDSRSGRLGYNSTMSGIRFRSLLATVLMVLGLVGTGPVHHALHDLVGSSNGCSGHAGGLEAGSSHGADVSLAAHSNAEDGSRGHGSGGEDGQHEEPVSAGELPDCAACGFSAVLATNGLALHLAALPGMQRVDTWPVQGPRTIDCWAPPGRGPPV